MSAGKVILKVVVPLAVTVGLCWLLFTGIDFKEMVQIIRTYCDFSYIWLMWLANIIAHVFRAMRWRIQLRALKIEAPLGALVLSIFGTYAVNLVFPRLGEVWRCGYIARRQDAPFTTVFGSMVADRLADTAVVALLLLFTLGVAGSEVHQYLGQNPDSQAALTDTLANPWLWTCVGLLLIGIWLVATKFRSHALVQKVKGLWKELWNGFAVIVKMPGKGKWLLLTALIWLGYFTGLLAAFHSFAFTGEIAARYGLTAVLVTFVLSSISMGVPSNGGIGPWQWSVIFALGFYQAGIAIPAGVSFDTMAASFANLVMAAQTLLLIILGIITFICIAVDRRKGTADDKKPTSEQI